MDDSNIKTIHALNKFYLEKISKMEHKDRCIHSGIHKDSFDSDRDVFETSMKVVFQTMSMTFGYVMAMTQGDIRKSKGIMTDNVNYNLAMLEDMYIEIYKNKRN